MGRAGRHSHHPATVSRQEAQHAAHQQRAAPTCRSDAMHVADGGRACTRRGVLQSTRRASPARQASRPTAAEAWAARPRPRAAVADGARSGWGHAGHWRLPVHHRLYTDLPHPARPRPRGRSPTTHASPSSPSPPPPSPLPRRWLDRPTTLSSAPAGPRRLTCRPAWS